MARRRDTGKPRHMRPAILVLCEGETEEVYVDFLRQQYRCPIKIVSKILGSHIDERRIRAIQDSMKLSGNDVVHTFFMYDRDVHATNYKLDSIKGVKLCSNPCIELWFLLHVRSVNASITSRACVDMLRHENEVWKDYSKAELTLTQRACLWNERLVASERAKKLLDFQNPSSTIYQLIEYLEDIV